MTKRLPILSSRLCVYKFFIYVLLITIILPAPAGAVAGYYPDSSEIAIDLRESGTYLQQDEFDRLDQFDLTAPQLRYPTRTIQVYLPADYYTSGKNYPVIYLHDGALLFNPDSRDCLYDETLDRLFEEGKNEGIIAVGIFASQNRWDEYSPWINTNMHDWIVPAKAAKREGGEGDAYLDFIVDTLKPEIDARYRTKTGPRNTAIGGFSMGGLISLYAGLKRPDVFSKVMAVSPAIWFAESGDYWLEENQLIDYINSIEVSKDVAFYIDIGTKEWEGVPINAVDQTGAWLGYPFVWVDGARATFNALEGAGVSGQNLILVEDPFGVHEPYSWAERFDDAIVWLFDGRETLPDPGLVTVVPPDAAEIIPTLISTVSTPILMPEDDATATPVVELTEEVQPEPTSAQNTDEETNPGLSTISMLKFFVIALVVLAVLVAAWLIKLVVDHRRAG